MFEYKLVANSDDALVNSLLEMPQDPNWRYVDWASELATEKAFYFQNVKLKLVHGYVSLHDYAQANFLTFCDDENSLYTLVQRLSCVWSVIKHDSNIAYVKKFPAGNRKRSFESFYKKINSKEINLSTPEFGGVLFSNHSRPYHQVYDCMPTFLEMSNKGFKCIINKDVSFIPSSMAGRDVSVVGSNDIKSSKDVFFVFPCIDRTLDLEKTVKDSLENLFSRKRIEYKSVPVIWLGLGGLKRTLVGLEDFLNSFINRVNDRHGECFFVFDGLTSLIGEESTVDLERYNKSEKELIQRVVEETGIQGSHALLFGEKAEQKLEWASITDFFVTNALTDSMWCSLFYRLPGVVHYSPASLLEVQRTQRHYKSYFVPADVMKNKKKKGKTASWTDYSIDSSLLSDICMEGLRSALFLKNYRLRILEGPLTSLREKIVLQKGNGVIFESQSVVSNLVDNTPFNAEKFEICFDIEILEGDGVFLVKDEAGRVLKESNEKQFYLTLEQASQGLAFIYVAREKSIIKFFGVRTQVVFA